MNASSALAKLRALGVPVLRTSEAAATLGLSTFAASKALTRLSVEGLVRSVRHGVWWVDGEIDPYRLPEYLTLPLPSYLSLQTALHLHGLIEQIPVVHYAASLGRTQRVVTSAGTFSIHHIAPEVFGGCEETMTGALVATPEKALFDVAYLSGGRTRLFTSLPELELPSRFRRAELRRWVERIPSARGRTLTTRKLEQLLTSSDRGR